MFRKRTYNRLENENKILLKKIEKEARNIDLFENMTDVVCILDKEGNYLDINAAGVKLYGYNRDEFLKMNVSQLIYDKDKTISKEYFSKLRTEGKYNLYEGRTVTKSKKIIWIQVNSTIFFENGKEIGSLDIIRDITEKKEIELKIQKQNIRLKELNATKDKLFSIIAHDLKAPFSSILGFCKLLNDNFENYSISKQKEFIENIYQSASKTYELLENLLLWSLSQRNKIDFYPELHNLYDKSSDAIEIFSHYADEKSIIINNNINQNISVFADKNMLLTVFRNLISNAIKFTKPNGTINISAIQNDKLIEISIEDSGVGISSNNQSKLFKIDKTKPTIGTNQEKGTGIGLILCKEFIDKHNGKIWAESKLGKGSKFIFTIPVK